MVTCQPPLQPSSLAPRSLDAIRACSLAHVSGTRPALHGCQRQSKGIDSLCAKPHPLRVGVPFAACCCSRIFRVRGVVPLGMLMMYFPSISAVTLRRLVGTARLSSSRRARTAGEGVEVSAFRDGMFSGAATGHPVEGTCALYLHASALYLHASA